MMERLYQFQSTLATVDYIQDKVSQEAFGGSSIKLLNGKNILLAGPEVTKLPGNTFSRIQVYAF